MDKYEFNIKVEKMKKAADRKDYATAAKVADSLNWEKSTNAKILMLIAQIYEKEERYRDARSALTVVYNRVPVGKRIVYKLTELSIKCGDMEEAQDLYREFQEIAPNDPSKLILAYRISVANGDPLEKQIAILEAYSRREFDEKWSYELATLYQQAGKADECVALCDEIILWFGVGPYVDRAMTLKTNFAPLSPEQEEKRANRELYEQKLNEVAAESRKEEVVMKVSEIKSFQRPMRNPLTAPAGSDSKVTSDHIMALEQELAQSIQSNADDQIQPETNQWVTDKPLSVDRVGEDVDGQYTLFRTVEEENGEASLPDQTRTFSFGSMLTKTRRLNSLQELKLAEETVEKVAEEVAEETPVEETVEEVAKKPAPETVEEENIEETSEEIEEAVTEEVTEVAEEEEISEPEEAPEEEIAETADVPKEEEAEDSLEEETTEPEETPKEEIAEPEETPDEEIAEPVETPDEDIAEPEETPDEEISEPEKTSDEEISEPEETSDEDPTVTQDDDEPIDVEFTLDEDFEDDAPKDLIFCQFVTLDEEEPLLNQIKEAHEMAHNTSGIPTAPVARISVDKINHVGLNATLRKLNGRDLLIENAGSLAPVILEQLLDAVMEPTCTLVILLADDVDGMEVLIDNAPELYAYFIPDEEDDEDIEFDLAGFEESLGESAEDDCPRESDDEDDSEDEEDSHANDDEHGDSDDDDSEEDDSEDDDDDDDDRKVGKKTKKDSEKEDEYAGYDTTPLTAAEFTEFLHQYAEQNDCRLDEMAELALAARIDKMELTHVPMTQKSGAQLMDKAIDKAERFTLRSVFLSRYDSEGYLVLKEKHF